MTRAAICGAALLEAARVLGLDATAAGADVVLVDLREPDAVAAAAAVAGEVPRVAVGGSEHELLIRAIGAPVRFSRSADPAELGPLVAAALPARTRRGSRVVLITGPCGGAGRTLLATNLAERLAATRTVLLLDVTGSGSAAWWVGLPAGPWSDLEGLVDELTPDHLAVVAAARGALRIVGGGPVAPRLALCLAAARAAPAVADLVLIDAPPLADERTRALAELADRVIVVVPDEPVTAAALEGRLDDRAWIVASRTRADRVAVRPVLRAIPDDPAAVRAAAKGPRSAGGAVGRAYDEIAELIAIDAS